MRGKKGVVAILEATPRASGPALYVQEEEVGLKWLELVATLQKVSYNTH